jgi:hypothetical protein
MELLRQAVAVVNESHQAPMDRRVTRRMLETKLSIAIAEQRRASDRLIFLKGKVALFKARHPNCESSLATAEGQLSRSEESLRQIRAAICLEFVNQHAYEASTKKSDELKAESMRGIADLARMAILGCQF